MSLLDKCPACASPMQADPVPEKSESDPATLLEALRKSAARLETAVLNAQREDDRTMFIRCSAELARNVALQHEIQTCGQGTDIAADVLKIRATARKLLSAVSDSPDAQNALRKALNCLGVDVHESDDIT